MSFIDEFIPKESTGPVPPENPTQASASANNVFVFGATSSSTSQSDAGTYTFRLQATPIRPLARHGAVDTITKDGQVSLLPHIAGFRRPLFHKPEEDTPRTAKRIKTHTDKVCDGANLKTKAREKVENFAKLNSREQMIAIFASLMDIECRLTLQEEEKRLEWALTLMESGFHTSLSNHVSSCLMAPDITAYVHKVPEVVMKLSNQHPSLFGIPKGMLHIQFYYAKLQKLVTTSCSQVRASMKTKLVGSMGKKRKGALTIVELCQNLAATSLGMEIKGDHMARAAFLQKCLVNFRELFQSSENEREETPAPDFTSDTATKVGSDASSTAPSTAASAKSYKTSDFWTFFQRVLADDLRTYRTSSGTEIRLKDLDFTPVVVPWQLTIAEAMVF
ncbi:hypothetical protein PQX77_019784 [Marasmius sp. AFHP31]|nr:hypothetical protein PQX77_019784 [Marasmius sp. AFHP31]